MHNSRSGLTGHLLFFIAMRKASKKSTGLEIRPRGDIIQKKERSLCEVLQAYGRKLTHQTDGREILIVEVWEEHFETAGL